MFHGFNTRPFLIENVVNRGYKSLHVNRDCFLLPNSETFEIGIRNQPINWTSSKQPAWVNIGPTLYVSGSAAGHSLTLSCLLFHHFVVVFPEIHFYTGEPCLATPYGCTRIKNAGDVAFHPPLFIRNHNVPLRLPPPASDSYWFLRVHHVTCACWVTLYGVVVVVDNVSFFFLSSHHSHYISCLIYYVYKHYSQTARHGFPHQPTALAYDPIQRLVAIGTKSGAIRM